jgi:hypothetical protein
MMSDRFRMVAQWVSQQAGSPVTILAAGWDHPSVRYYSRKAAE